MAGLEKSHEKPIQEAKFSRKSDPLLDRFFRRFVATVKRELVIKERILLNMLKKRYSVTLSESIIKPDFLYSKNGSATFECRELISQDTIGSKEIVVFRAVFGPKEAHSKHRHTKCDEIVHCIAGRGVEGVETEQGVYKEYVYVPGTTMYLPKGTGHYTRNPDNFDNLLLIGIFPGVPDMDKKTTGYESCGDITEEEKVLQ
jgi:quercetin dioxygenase-like cupin family protein